MVLANFNPRGNDNILLTLYYKFAISCTCNFGVTDMLWAWGFCDRFVDWIRGILESASPSILINGSPEGYFGCGRGVRHGDPLSPLLFCVGEECLSRMLIRAQSSGRLVPFHIGRRGFSHFPTHLLYADDIIIFYQATVDNCRSVVQILNQYADLSGQVFNPAKSRVYLSTGMDPEVRLQIGQELGIGLDFLPFVYLGVPLFRGAPRVQHLRGIADSILAKVRRWKGRSLSIAGRICLVESVVKPSLNHTMMVYRWPRELLDRLDWAIRNFIWTGDISTRAPVPVRCDTCCLPKREGGLGLKSISEMNEALNAKFTWHVYTSDESFMKLLRASMFYKGKPRDVISSVLPGVRRVFERVRDGAIWLVNSKSNVRFWLDNWLGYIITDMTEIPLDLRHLYGQPISHYYIDGVWQITEGFCMGQWDIVQEIIGYRFRPTSDKDEIIWRHSSKGDATAKHFFRHFRSRAPEVTWGSWIWAPFIQPARSIIIWRALLGRLATWDNLLVLGFAGPSRCHFCLDHCESIDHIFVRCYFVRYLWARICGIFQVTPQLVHNFRELVDYAMSQQFSTQIGNLWRLAIVFVVWFIWRNRNMMVFDGIVITTEVASRDLSFFITEAGSSSLGAMNNTNLDLNILREFKISGVCRRGPKLVVVRWLTPLFGWMKCNTDGSSDGTPGTSTSAGIFHSSYGFVHACFVRKVGVLFAFEAELVAAMIGVELAHGNEWMKLWLESDSTYVVQLFISRSLDVPWKFENRWRSVLALISTMDFRISHIYREGNTVADALSKHFEDADWVGAPDFILPLVSRDTPPFPYFRYVF